MLRYFQAKRSSRLWRTVYIASAFFVFAYIAFDVLDLDLSDFPLKRPPLERSAVVTQVAKDTEHSYIAELPQFWGRVSSFLTNISDDSQHFRYKQVVTSLRFDSARTRVYRIALPRFSTEKSSPSA